jgi:hypothetical protein
MIDPKEYLNLGDGKFQKFSKQAEDVYKKIKSTMEKLGPFDHVKIIEEVIKAHVGAKNIKIRYNPPGLTSETIKYLENVWSKAEWSTCVNEDMIIVTNFPVLDKDPVVEFLDYSGYPYRNIEQRGIKFSTSRPVGHDVDLINTLIALKDYIKVELYDLRLPLEYIVEGNAVENPLV